MLDLTPRPLPPSLTGSTQSLPGRPPSSCRPCPGGGWQTSIQALPVHEDRGPFLRSQKRCAGVRRARVGDKRCTWGEPHGSLLGSGEEVALAFKGKMRGLRPLPRLQYQ